jgi:hypothetical protein
MGDSYALLVNEGARSNRMSALYMWKRNPMFYLSATVAVFSAAALIVHAVWGFTVGITVSLFTVVLASWFAAAIVDHYARAPRVVSSWVKLKTGFFVMFFLALYAALIYLQVLQLEVYFAAGAGFAEAWSSFPDACRTTAQSPPINCVRAGLGVPNPLASPGSDLVPVPLFNTTLGNAADALRGILQQREDFRDCHLLADASVPVANASALNNATAAHFLHWRCLSDFLGYPDDLAVLLSCQQGSVVAWFHSQSRLDMAQWDHGSNDARVRLVLAYASLPVAWYPFNAQLNTTATCS